MKRKRKKKSKRRRDRGKGKENYKGNKGNVNRVKKSFSRLLDIFSFVSTTRVSTLKSPVLGLVKP